MKQTIQTLEKESPLYPALLNEIHQPPAQLYFRGNAELLNHERLIAIVGARKATSYGRTVVRRIVEALVEQDFVTVSGLAYGIDGAVHKETLRAGGKTIAVLGSSVHHEEIYPKVHTQLAESILENDGLLLSEFPVGTETYPGNFPQRNRIIAGLGPATIVVEANTRSGSLITARFAREQNREVFAVPGPITCPQSRGTNWLIEQGATPWISFDSLDSLFHALPQFEPQNHTTVQKIAALSEIEKTIYALCSEPQTIDALVLKSGFPVHIILQTITALLLAEVIHDFGNGQYQQQ